MKRALLHAAQRAVLHGGIAAASCLQSKHFIEKFFVLFTKQPDHIPSFDIGIYDSTEKALSAVDELKVKEGFCLRPDKFYIYRVLRFREPKLLNQTYWVDGFTTYTYTK